MPINRNALIRFKTIDKCLSNPYRKWTLEMLIEECSEALYEYEGIDKGVSKRTIQADIQIMRSDKLGYNAPIEVYDKKYYKYTDPDFSITKRPLSMEDLKRIEEATDILRQFKGFSHFKELNGVVQKIEDTVYSQRNNSEPIIIIDQNENLKGIEYLDFIYRAILDKKVLNINYQSFKARQPGKLIFHPFLLKEYNNRWFLIGCKEGQNQILTLALDRIYSVEINTKITYKKSAAFNPKEYYYDVVGVTVNNRKPQTIQLFVNQYNAPYMITKPLHHSQKVIEKCNNGIIIEIKVIPNYELERLILGFGAGMKIISPLWFKKRIQKTLIHAVQNYNDQVV